MPETRPSEVVGFETGPVVDAALEAVEGPLYSVVEFDRDAWNHLYVADETRVMYEEESHMLAHFDRIHSYVNMDFTELQLFTDTLVPAASEVRYLVTCLDVIKLVRFYHGTEGLFIAIDPTEPVEPLVDALTGTIEG